VKRHLTEHLAELAFPPLADAVARGEGFEVIVAGVAVRWCQTSPPAEDEGVAVWELAQVGGHLRAGVVLQTDPDLHAGSYQVTLTNAGDSPVVMDAVHPLVVRFPGVGGPWRVLRARGGTTENFYPPRAYSPAERVVFGGEVRIESPPGGRSSDRHLPLLLATAGAEPGAAGVFAGMAYSGEWFLTLRHVGDGPFLRGRLKASGVVLAPGETLALPAAHVGFFDGGLSAGTNALRRYLTRRVCPKLGSEAMVPPVLSLIHISEPTRPY